MFLIVRKDFLSREQKLFQSRPETYNGADRDLYSWTQTITDLDVRVKVKSFDFSLEKENLQCNRLDSETHQKGQRSESDDQ